MNIIEKAILGSGPGGQTIDQIINDRTPPELDGLIVGLRDVRKDALNFTVTVAMCSGRAAIGYLDDLQRCSVGGRCWFDRLRMVGRTCPEVVESAYLVCGGPMSNDEADWLSWARMELQRVVDKEKNFSQF